MRLFIKLIVLFSTILQYIQYSQGQTVLFYSGATAPDNWPSLVPTCGGQMQSPIDIKDATEGSALSAITFEDYDATPTKMDVGNIRNGVVGIVEGVRANISEAALPAKYTFTQVDFRWGSVNGQGSEHTINGKQYDAEIQLIHIQPQYSSYTTAIDQEDGVAVLAVLVEVGDANSKLDEFVKVLPDVQQPGNVTVVGTPFPLMNFLPEKKDYYRYRGGQTYPECKENIMWTVFTNPITMSQAQIDAFRALIAFKNTTVEIPLVNNFRPVQALNGRTVMIFGESSDDSNDNSDCSSLSATTVTVTLSLIVPLWLHLQN